MGIRFIYAAALFLTPLLLCIGTMYGVFQDRIDKRKKKIGYKYILRCQCTELLFVFCIVKCYMDSIFCVSKLIQYYVIEEWTTWNQKDTFYMAYAVALIVTMYPMWLFIRKLLRPLINKTEHMKFWYMAWLVPLCYYLLYRTAISPDYKHSEEIMEGTKSFLPLLWITVVFLSLGVMIKMMLESTYVVEEREKRKSVERQLIIQQEQYERIQQGVEYAKKLRHDQRHHFLAIAGYVQNEEIDKLKQYLADYQETILPEEYLVVCDNYAVNAVAQHMLQRAIRTGVEVETHIDLDEECDIIQSDLVVLIGNLLENAIEACERQKEGMKFLRMTTFWPSESMLAIVLENSYQGAIKECNGIFLSSKRDEEGIGISSVKEIAEKHHGVAKFEYDNKVGVFKASILLNL